ncbi:gasdermin-D isoform X4 [Manis javanica]|uniref:gasdermin-D isoform X4 n=1 Tax=Manis javanica TaxID=9974 RepID=UPI003C6D646F
MHRNQVGQATASKTGPQLWSCSSCGARWPLPFPRRHGRAAEGQCGAHSRRAGAVCRRSCSVWKLQCLNECVHAPSGPQHLGRHAPREAAAAARTQGPAAAAAPWGQRVCGDGGAADANGGGGHPDPQARGLGPVCPAWSCVLAGPSREPISIPQGKGQGHLSRKKTVTIPSGSILAFQVAQLVIGSDWDILLFPDKKQKTFKPPQEASFHSDLGILSDGTYKDWLAATEFQGLKAEVECQAKGLESLSKEVSRQLLGGLRQVLREELALQVLQESLEQGLCCGRMEPPDGPAGIILECLVLSSGELEKELAGPILYLLEALDVLNETQHMLLAEELQAGALPGQVKLVGSLLEQSSPWQEHRAIYLLPKFLGSSWGSEGPAWVLLEECGLELQVGAPQVFWEPEAQGRTCALYACLSLLLELSYLC